MSDFLIFSQNDLYEKLIEAYMYRFLSKLNFSYFKNIFAANKNPCLFYGKLFSRRAFSRHSRPLFEALITFIHLENKNRKNVWSAQRDEKIFLRELELILLRFLSISYIISTDIISHHMMNW